MSWLDKVFGRRTPPSEPLRDLRPLVAPHLVPAAHLTTSDAPSRSYFGGDPQLPQDRQWPEHAGKPLTCLARVSLRELQQAVRLSWLPIEGALVFFYDADEQPWGFEPNERGGSAVLHVPDLSTPRAASRTAASGGGLLASRNMRFERIESLPSLDRLDTFGGHEKLSSRESDVYAGLADAPFGDRPRHQIGGWPSPIQSDDMELEAQLVSHGIYCGDPSGYASAEARALEPGAKDWRLLLQLDSDDDMDVMWGDAGILYFWVRVQDAAAGRFDGVWAILQCH